MLLRKLLLGAGLVTSMGASVPAFADCPPAPVVYSTPGAAVEYGAPAYTPVYYGAGYRYGYGRRYYAPVRRVAPVWGWGHGYRYGRGWGHGRRW